MEENKYAVYEKSIAKVDALERAISEFQYAIVKID